MPISIIPNLWFNGVAVEAAEFYCSIFPNSKILATAHYTEAGPGPAGAVMTVNFELDGERIIAINAGPEFQFSEAISLLIECRDQAEIDYYWGKLCEGGTESRCGWLKDRYGLSWQVAPLGMDEIFADPDPSRAERAMRAMFEMNKLDLAALLAAAAGPG